MRAWVFNPHSGGSPIPKTMHSTIHNRLVRHTCNLFPKVNVTLSARFKNQFCYVDYSIDDNQPMPLCRLRYFDFHKKWSLGFFSYANERYEPSILRNGEFMGTLEEAFEPSTVHHAPIEPLKKMTTKKRNSTSNVRSKR